MGELLDRAFNDVMSRPREEVTYEVLARVVEDEGLVGSHATGWKQVMRLVLCVSLLDD